MEIGIHRTEEDCWIAVHGMVYNVTHFINDHPGGKDKLLPLMGQDGTKEWDKQGHGLVH